MRWIEPSFRELIFRKLISIDYYLERDERRMGAFEDKLASVEAKVDLLIARDSADDEAIREAEERAAAAEAAAAQVVADDAAEDAAQEQARIDALGPLESKLDSALAEPVEEPPVEEPPAEETPEEEA
jgi:hypothetical protein